jgi:hypothetical protein
LLFCFTCFFASLPLRFSVCLSMLFCFFSFSAFWFALLLCLPAFLLTCFFAFYAFPFFFGFSYCRYTLGKIIHK